MRNGPGQEIDAQGLTPAWNRLTRHPLQMQAFGSRARVVVIAAGRGSGKTEIAMRRLVIALAEPKPWPDPRYFFAGPTATHVRDIAWARILSLVPESWLSSPPRASTDSMLIQTRFGSQLQLFGLNQERVRIEGRQWDGGIIDESAYVNPGVFDTKIAPALIWREGWAWRIGVPKRAAPGSAEFRAAFERGLRNVVGHESYTWPSADIVPQHLLDYYRETLDPKDYAEQLEASWVTAGGLVFFAFSREHNVRPCPYRPQHPLTVSCDFNVSPMAWIIGHRFRNRMEWIDELWLNDTHTAEALDVLWGRYQSHRAGFEFFGDAAGHQRRTSAGSVTDWAIIANDTRFKQAGRQLFVGRSNPAVADRFGACNAMFCNAKGERRCFIDPRCQHLIWDLENRAYKPGTSEPNDKPGTNISHATDAIGYTIARCWPVVVELDDYAPTVTMTGKLRN